MNYVKFSMWKELDTVFISADSFHASVTDSSSVELFQAWLKSAKETVIELIGDGEISVTDLRLSVSTGNMYVHTYVRDALGLKSDVGFTFLPSLVVPDDIVCEVLDCNLVKIISACLGGTIRKVLDLYFVSESKDNVVSGMENNLPLCGGD